MNFPFAARLRHEISGTSVNFNCILYKIVVINIIVSPQHTSDSNFYFFGINSFDSPYYGQNIGTMATTTNNGYTTPEFKRKASFKLTENNRQRTNVVGSERRRQSPLVSQTTKRQGSRKRILKQKKKILAFMTC